MNRRDCFQSSVAATGNRDGAGMGAENAIGYFIHSNKIDSTIFTHQIK
jgi:hypothetical protein